MDREEEQFLRSLKITSKNFNIDDFNKTLEILNKYETTKYHSIKLRPDIYEALKLKHMQTMSPLLNMPTIYGMKVKIDPTLVKPYELIREEEDVDGE